jgi:O-antigen/teichoic acid export membrane protein
LIINLVRRSFQNTFLKVTGANGLISVAKAFLVIISNKVLAIVIGATGIAMIGQLQNFTTIITQISNGGFNQGLTKYIAENRDNKNEVKEFVGTAFRISFLLTSVTALFIILLSGFLSSRIFDTLEYNSILIIFAFTLFFYNLNSLILSIINGFQEYRKYFKINITTTVVGFVLTIGLVLLLKEYGALLAIVLSQSIVSIFAYFLYKKGLLA